MYDTYSCLMVVLSCQTIYIMCPRCTQVNLKYGVPNDTRTLTATAGAGSLLLEFGTLSRLLGDPTFENVARRSVHEIWMRRNINTGLLGVLLH